MIAKTDEEYIKEWHSYIDGLFILMPPNQEQFAELKELTDKLKFLVIEISKEKDLMQVKA